jgi:hypothetical protein
MNNSLPHRDEHNNNSLPQRDEHNAHNTIPAATETFDNQQVGGGISKDDAVSSTTGTQQIHGLSPMTMKTTMTMTMTTTTTTTARPRRNKKV